MTIYSSQQYVNPDLSAQQYVNYGQPGGTPSARWFNYAPSVQTPSLPVQQPSLNSAMEYAGLTGAGSLERIPDYSGGSDIGSYGASSSDTVGNQGAVSGSPFGGLSTGTIVGLAGTALGALVGIPGLGFVGTGIGTAMDVASHNAALSNMGVTQGHATLGPAMLSDMTFGLAGASPVAQSAAMGSDAFSGAPVGGTIGGDSVGSGDSEMSMSGGGQATVGSGDPGADSLSDGGGSGGGGGGSKVICGALFHHGLMPHEMFILDSQMGRILAQTDPDVMVGYHWWAKPIAEAMTKRKWLAKMIQPIAMPWARYIAGDVNTLGAIYWTVGVPICRFIGEWRMKRLWSIHHEH